MVRGLLDRFGYFHPEFKVSLYAGVPGGTRRYARPLTESISDMRRYTTVPGRRLAILLMTERRHQKGSCHDWDGEQVQRLWERIIILTDCGYHAGTGNTLRFLFQTLRLGVPGQAGLLSMSLSSLVHPTFTSSALEEAGPVIG